MLQVVASVARVGKSRATKRPISLTFPLPRQRNKGYQYTVLQSGTARLEWRLQIEHSLLEMRGSVAALRRASAVGNAGTLAEVPLFAFNLLVVRVWRSPTPASASRSLLRMRSFTPYGPHGPISVSCSCAPSFVRRFLASRGVSMGYNRVRRSREAAYKANVGSSTLSAPTSGSGSSVG
jgi:hypothetical protein